MITAHLGQGGSAIIASHIDLGLPHTTLLDLTPYAASIAQHTDVFDGVTA